MTKDILKDCAIENEISNIAFLDDTIIKDRIWKAKVINILKRSKLITLEESKQLENLLK